jgi:flavin reductase (DIM6/NTAB) family NADH-FMN oxidoreductase RutF
MIIDFNTLDSKQRYKVMSQSIIPRPIAWIVTDDNGKINVAPFSYFTPLSSNPATIIVSIGHKADGSQKDSLYNILNRKKATICFVDDQNLNNMILSATPLDKNISEIEEYDIAIENIKTDYPPIIKGVKSALFCEFYKKIELEGNTVPLILEIKHQYFEDKIIDEKLNINLDNICRVGKSYASLEPIDL